MVGALVRDPGKPRPTGAPAVVGSLEALLERRPQVIVECAGHDALRRYGAAVLRSGLELIVLSVGALADDELLAELRASVLRGGRLRIATGAIVGLDGLAAAALGGLTSVTHTIRKPARTLLGAAADALREPRELFAGPAREGVARFPESANVVAAVSLAGIGFDRTVMRVVADPAATRNEHRVEAEGTFGSLRVEVRNVPSDENPRTGRLTAMGAYQALIGPRAAVAIG